jgi:serine/threonine protein kinase
MVMNVDPSRLKHVRKLARGAFGDVHLALYEGREVAVKTIREAPGANMDLRYRWFLQERDLLRSLRHPRFAEFLGSYVPEGAETWAQASLFEHAPCLVFRYCEGGSLATCLSHARNGSWEGPVLPLADVYRASFEIASALAHLHSLGYVHRDVKASNVFVDLDGSTRLGDFGMAVREDRVTPGRVGSCRWMAPEVCRGEPYGKPADTFSFGALVTELVSGRVPHSYISELAVADLTGSGLRARVPKHCPADLRKLVESCFREEPLLRPRMEDLARDLEGMLWDHAVKGRRSVDVPAPVALKRRLSC